jgi:hypothetical protein
MKKSFINRLSLQFAALLLFAGCSLSTAFSAFNSQEQAIANYLVSHPEQRRPFMKADPILSQVARAKAQDMANRGYYSHVNPEGQGPNYLVERAGYDLPDWWGSSISANYVESITAGYADASSSWNQWMGSAPHKNHILAHDSFYADQTSYGVGFASNPGSPYQYYWVIITAPPASGPDLEITSPAPNSRFSVPQVTVAGKTKAGSGVASVQVAVENASGFSGFKPASGTDNWQAALSGFTPGTNRIWARTFNQSGQQIAQVSHGVYYVVKAPLTVGVSGGGSVTAGFMGTTQREINKVYQISAKPNTGWFFTGWSGSVNSVKSGLSYYLREASSLTANFATFSSNKGGYNGLIQNSAGVAAGFFSVNVTGNGGFTGRVTWKGVSSGFSGAFNQNGKATVTINRAGSQPLTLNLNLAAAEKNGKLTGTVAQGTTRGDFGSELRLNGTSSDPVEMAGRYTLVLPAAGDAAPQGNGCAIVNISATGMAKINGWLPDGSAFTQSVPVSENGQIPLFAVLYGGKGLIAGKATISSTSTSDMTGTLIWKKPANSSSYYGEGFSTQRSLIGSRYAAPAAGEKALGTASQATVGLESGNIPAPATGTVQVEPAAFTGNSSGFNANLQVTSDTGFVTGTLLHPETGASTVARGVVFQKQPGVYGYFLGTNRSGEMTISPQ